MGTAGFFLRPKSVCQGRKSGEGAKCTIASARLEHGGASPVSFLARCRAKSSPSALDPHDQHALQYRYLIRTRLCADSMFHLDFLPESPHLPRPQFHTGISSPPQLNFEWSFETAMSLHHEVKRSRHNLELSITYEHTTAHLPR
jgi:hypothetical protein